MSKQILEEVLGKRDAKHLWGAGYRTALPLTPQDFALESVLPAVIYMARWGHRRGKGKFTEVFGTDATVANVAAGLARLAPGSFDGFNDEVRQAILSDLLLAFCLENKGHGVGRDKVVMRNFLTHYYSSWVDLPKASTHLRYVPEMLAAILARQDEGKVVARGKGHGHYQVGAGFNGNLLLGLFSDGVVTRGSDLSNLQSDVFDEQTPVDVDQLLAVRLGLALGEAPLKLRGDSPEIPNQRPLAALASETFYEDLNVFLRAYGRVIPRQSLLPMLESCLAVGLTTLLTSTIQLIYAWEETGTVPAERDQRPLPLFVDCSNSLDHGLRRYSEESMEDLERRLARLPALFLCLRILDLRAEEEKLPDLPESEPDPTARINFLGDLIMGRHDDSRDLSRDLRRVCNKLADALDEADSAHLRQLLLADDPHPAHRLAEAIVQLMGDKLQGTHYRKLMDSCLMLDRPNGLARKRRAIIKGKSGDRRSVTLTNTVVDFLVHRHLRKSKKGTGPAALALGDFVEVLRTRYGFYIDEAPPGLAIPNDELRKNRAYLERRLRDLGLLVGVNDAESMKLLRQRFEVPHDA